MLEIARDRKKTLKKEKEKQKRTKKQTPTINIFYIEKLTFGKSLLCYFCIKDSLCGRLLGLQ